MYKIKTVIKAYNEGPGNTMSTDAVTGCKPCRDGC